MPAASFAAGGGSAGGGFGGTGILLGVGGAALLGAAAGGGGGSSSSGGTATAGTGTTGTGTAPGAPTSIALAAASDSGVAGDGITNVRTPTITGRGDAGSTIEIRGASGATLATATVDAAGNWSATPTAPLAEGATTLQVVATRGAGSAASAPVAFALTIDATAPAVPGATLGEGLVVNRAENADGLVATISGGFAAGDTIALRLTRPDSSVLNVTRAVTAAEAAAGTASFAIPAQTLEGSYALVASVTDVAGNAGAASAPLAARFDLQGPAVPTAAATLSVNEGFGAFDLTAAGLGATDNQSSGAGLTVTSVTFKGSTTFAATDLAIAVAGGKATVAPSAAGADRNGAFTLTVTVQDEAGNTATRDVVVTVAPVNDAPSGRDATLLVNTGASHTFFAADFGFSDAADAPGDALKSVVITTLPGAGQLRLDGAATKAGQEISAADLAANKLTFVPGAGASGPSYASFTFQVRDTGGTANGGADLDATPNRLTFSVGNFNDPPLLNAARSPAFTTPEYAFSGGGDASGSAPTGASPAGVFTVGALVDFATPSGQVDNVTDPDAGAKLGIGVTRLTGSAPGATLWYSTNGGTSWDWVTNTAGSKVAGGFFGANGAAGGGDDAVLLLADTARLVFDAGASGTGAPIADALTFRAWDQTTGTNGEAVVSPAFGNTTSLSIATDTAQANFSAPAIDLTRLDAAAGVRIAGVTAGGLFGRDLDGVGDVDGDGYDDLLVTQYGSVASDGGSATLIYGRAGAYGSVGADGTRSAAVDTLARDTFARPGEFFTGASKLGDFNRDGYADLLIATDAIGGPGAGGAYVIFGGPAVQDIPKLALTTPGGGWFRIADSFYGIGAQPHTISWAGDVNGDGYDDLVVGAKIAPTAGAGTFGSGLAVVVYGHAGTSFGANNVLDLAPFGVDPTTLIDTGGMAGHVLDAGTNTRGIVIGAGPEGNGLAWGSSVGGLGDRNGDGYADFGVIADLGGLLVNAIALHGKLATDNGGNVMYLGGPPGPDWVGHGTAPNTGVNNARIRLAGLGADVTNQAEPDRITIQGVGDVNGDGFDDFAMAYNGVRNGEVYVIYGNGTVLSDDTVPSYASGTKGFRISGAAAGDKLGESVRGVGDVNGDGYDDLLVGAPRNDVGVAGEQGAAYLVYGGPDAGANDLDLAAGLPAARGIAIRGSTAGDQAGFAVAGAGDVNGDGLADLLIGAPGSDVGAIDGGAAWLIYGRTAYGNAAAATGTSLTGTSGADALVGTAGNDTLSGGAGGADAISGGAGNDTITVGSNAYRRVDGGTGFDTLRIGAAMTLDFTAVGSGAGQNLSGHTRGIERIDLVAGSQAGTLRLSEQDVYALAGDYTAPAGAAVAGRQSNTLFVTGDAGDTLTFAEGIGGASGWRATGLVTANAAGDGVAYTLYQRGTASVYVDARISLADTIAGGAAGETLVGGLGSDAISGGGGNDTLYGGTLGSTPATSQAGVRDVFAWSMQSGLAQGADVVKDFQRGTDRLYLTDVRDTTSAGGAGLTLRDVTQADSPTQYVTLGNDGTGNLRLTFVAGGTSSSVVLEGVLFEATAVANNGRYGSLAELFGTGETRLLYLTADPFSPGIGS